MSLTKKQKLVYDFICSYRDEHGYSPTQMEIKEYFQFKSLGSVQDYIRYLKNSGHLINDLNSVRGLQPVIKEDSSIHLNTIPLLGKVAAGKPIEAIEGADSIDVPIHMLKSGNHFALTISGESMIEDGIFNGDIIVVKQQTNAKNGDTVVAVIDGDATVKKFFKKSQSIELHPANSTMKPIIIKNKPIEIKGILVGLLRAY